MKKSLDVHNPRRLRKQHAWYYLPAKGDRYLTVVCGGDGPGDVKRVSIPIKKLMRELAEAVKLLEAK